jgi:hypothetical protein
LAPITEISQLLLVYMGEILKGLQDEEENVSTIQEREWSTMKYKIKIALICFVLTLFVPLFSMAQTTKEDQPTITVTKVQGNIPSKDAYIVKYSVDTTNPNDYIATGNLTIEYSDGTKVVEKVPPARKSSENETVFNKVGFNDVEVSSGRRTIGWTELFENCGTSYPIPEVLAIYQSGKTITHIKQGQMVWFWRFLDGGKKIAAVWGPTHGREVGYQLYDVSTGRMLSEVFGNEKSQSLDPDAPEWAKQTEQEMNHQ